MEKTMDKKACAYDFRNHNFLEVKRLNPTPNAAYKACCTVLENWEIVLPITKSRLAKYYSHDLFSFLADAFGICLRVRFVENIAKELQKPQQKILLLTEKEVPDIELSSEQAGAFSITVTEEMVLIVGKSERGTAQGVYYLEDCMRLRGEETLQAEQAEHAPLFSPRMTHSGIELDTFSDEYLAAVAHAGMDAIIVYAGTPDTHLHGFEDPDALWSGNGKGYCDFNHLVWRAEGYGLDVYVYSHIKCDVYPDEKNAAEYYENSFGTLFRQAPNLKGIIFVGETFEFPSKDPHTCGVRNQLRPKDDKRRSPGWYPCFDYPLLLQTVKNTICAYNPNADIVFWSYNWGWAKKEERLALIENLPRDITLLVTFEMWEYLKDDHGDLYKIADYSISFPGPSQVFVDEAEKAKACGIRLYAMSNTGGRTWDVGSAPYLPVPQQWKKRYEALRVAKEAYGLCGLMENHHYGWMPSFLNLFAKNAFTTNTKDDDSILEEIAKRDWGGSYLSVIEAWKCFSEGISLVVACGIDQYGPYRSGPTYPLVFTQTREDLAIPSVPWAMHKGFAIWDPIYSDTVFSDVRNSLMRLRHIQDVVRCFEKGVAILKGIVEKKNLQSPDACIEQLTVADYIRCCFVTALHVMQWNIAKRLLFALEDTYPREEMEQLQNALSLSVLDAATLSNCLRSIAQAENDNVAQALACWEQDSRLGFEASMEYVFDHNFAAWKNSVINESLVLLEKYTRTRIHQEL